VAGPAAAAAGATAMCDVSDGLLADTGHLAAASGVVVDLDRAALVQACLVPEGTLQQVGSALGVDPLVWVLTGGEDHALVATFPAATPLPPGWQVIGAVRSADPGAGVRVDGQPAEAAARALGAEGTGHAHFG
jgi:thiamine-monophosphate kinase